MEARTIPPAVPSHAPRYGSRRQFLKQTAFLPAGFLAANGLVPEEANSGERSDTPHLPAKIKISLNAWSFSVPLYAHLHGKEGGMSLFDLLEYCAEYEFDALDPTGYFFPGYPEVPARKYINEFKRRAFQLGIDISGTGIRNDFATADEAKRAEGIELVKKWTEVASWMGAPVLRVFAGTQPEGYTWDQVATWMAEALKECTKYGEQQGVLIGLQNHGGMLANADEMLKLVELVDSDWMGLIIDTGWLSGPDPYRDIERTMPHAVNWQVKEFFCGDETRKTDLKRVARLIRKSNYRGYVPIETLNSPGKKDSHLRVPNFLKEWRAAIAETA
jgi:sugar phosphate isomerase/epimerase